MFHAGIPVWLVRPLQNLPADGQTGLRVDKWVDGDPLYLKDGLPSRDSNLTLRLDEWDPPHPDVFTGPARSLKRFVAMGKYIHHLATSHVYTTGEDDATTVTTTALPLTASSASSAGPSRTEPSSATKRLRPYQKPKSSKTLSTPTERNKFVDVTTPVMPRGLPAWVEASRKAGKNFNTQQIPPSGIDNAYSLPDLNTLVVKNETTSTSFIYLLRASLEREAMEAMIDFTNLNGMPMEIDDLRITVPMLQQVTLRREVLWELFEINFPCELIRLDHVCYRFLAKDGEDVPMEDERNREQGELGAADLASSPAEREMQVLSIIPHFNGELIPTDAKEAARLGFAAESLEKRREAWWGLYRVMLGWKDEYAMSEQLREMGRRKNPNLQVMPR
ncbi:hypothetical protein BDZ89DRAFT_1142897 [Hymenopellis radicata]|nr:hypothetical protein BDZ89DRAFT_1142897 [Hymenopellis radicata]